MRVLLILAALLTGSLCFSRQSDWWPKTRDVDKDYLTFVDQLMRIGLPDPRGGVFSKVIVHEQDPAESHTIEVIACGWVKPGSNRVAAVNGLEYDLVKLLEPVDTLQFINSSDRYFRHQGEDKFKLQVPSMTFYAMLLVAGKIEQVLGNPFYKRELAKDYLEMVRFRCLASTKVGKYDDALRFWGSLRDLAKLAYNQKILETSAEWPVIESLDSIERLGREIRRKKHRSENSSAVNGSSLDQAIDNLEDARLQYQPFASKKWPEYQAVIDFGESAVPKLIEAYKNETTLSCVFYRPWGELPTGLVPVSTSAWQMILTLWPQALYLGPYNSLPSPEILKAKWNSVKGLSSQERYIELLTDPSLRTDAYEYIFMNLQGSLGFKPSILRESFGSDLTVLDWLKRRAHQTLDAAEPGSAQEASQITAAIRMIRLYNVATEEPDIDFLRKCSDRILTALETNKNLNLRYSDREIQSCIFVLSDRQKLGDFTTGVDITRINDIVSKIPGLDQNGASLLTLDFLEPGFRSLLVNIETNLTEGSSGSLQNSMELVKNLMDSRCIEKPILRHTLSRLVLLSPELFKAQVRGQSTASFITLTSHQTSSFSVYFSGPALDEISANPVDLATGDVIALMLWRLPGCPPFNPFGLTNDRERQREAISNWLLNDNHNWRAMPVFTDPTRNWPTSPWKQLQNP